MNRSVIRLSLIVCLCTSVGVSGEVWAEEWFGPVISTPLGYSVKAVGYGDLNGDGRTECITRDAAYDLRVYEANPDGMFEITDTRMGSYHQCTVGDLNGNGRPELIAVASTTLYVFEVSPEWQLPVAPVSMPIMTMSSLTAVVARDIDEDGCDDLVVAGADGVCVVWGDPSGPLGPGAFFEVPVEFACIGEASVNQIGVAEVTGDTLLDVVVGVRWGRSDTCLAFYAGLKVLRRTGARSFEYDDQWIGYVESQVDSQTGYTDLEVADFDGDAVCDLLSDRLPGGYRAFKGFGNGNFAGAPTNLVGGYFYTTSHDFDGDEVLDLGVGNGGVTRIYSGSGSFDFNVVQLYAGAASAAIWVQAAKCNNDDLVDVVGVSATNSVNVYPRVSATSTAESGATLQAGRLGVMPSVIGAQDDHCTFIAPATGENMFEVFDIRGRMVAVIKAGRSGSQDVRGVWRWGEGDSRPSPGVYLVRLGEEGPTGRVTVVP
ncbi:MAG: VCBS repeat-containing protein [Candidatus Eisenbacteria bacterium]|nr:VCBS repeat-containing protein [Candidatus Eisenbacteria bacterium]